MVSSSVRVSGREHTLDSPAQDTLRVAERSLDGSPEDLSLGGSWNATAGSLSSPVFVFQELSAAHYSLYTLFPQGGNSHRAKLPTRSLAGERQR